MNLTERNRKLGEFFGECRAILEKKGKDYSPSGVAFEEIRKEAEDLGLRAEQVMLVLAGKHWGAIKTWAKTGALASEPIRERLKDLANYCALMAVMVDRGAEADVKAQKEMNQYDGLKKEFMAITPASQVKLLGRKCVVFDSFRFKTPLTGEIIGKDLGKSNLVQVMIHRGQINGHLAYDNMYSIGIPGVVSVFKEQVTLCPEDDSKQNCDNEEACSL